MLLETRHTREFFAAWLPRPPARVLEIGCGSGALAAQLALEGFRVVALDSDPDAIAAARALGVAAYQATWPAFAVDFDTVLFSRTLHHLAPLELAVERAGTALAHGGKVLVEDVAFHSATPATIAWLREQLVKAEQAGFLLPRAVLDRFVLSLFKSRLSLPAWLRGANGMQPVEAMEAALAEHLVLESRSRVPYLYRYVARALSPSGREQFLEEVFREEQRLGEQGAIEFIGARFVAARRNGATAPSSMVRAR